MKYSLRSLMIAVLVLPPLLAWGALPLYRWLTTPKPRSSLSIAKPNTTLPLQQGTIDLREPIIGYPSEAGWKRLLDGTAPSGVELPDDTLLPNSQAPAPTPPKA